MADEIVHLKKCSVEDCDRPHLAKGLCSMHWQRVNSTGTTELRVRPDLWSDEEIEAIKTLYEDTPNKELQREFLPRRSIRAMNAKAREMGLYKTTAARSAAMEHVYEARRGSDRRDMSLWTTRECAVCGETFEVRKSMLRSGWGRHCSHRCASDAKKKLTGEDHPLYRLVDRKCEWCGEGFKTKPAKIAYGEGRFCSNSCVGSYTTMKQGGRRSSIERLVEEELKRLGIEFVPQKKMGRFNVDFYVPSMNLVIECDGDYWHSRPEVVVRDRKKDRWMAKNDVNISRITESEIKADCPSAVKKATQRFSAAC